MSSLFELAQSWLEGFEADPRRVVYERLYRLIYRRWVEAFRSSHYRFQRGKRMLDVGAGYGNSLLLFRELPWQFVALEKFPQIADRLRQRIDEVEGVDVEVVEKDVVGYVCQWAVEGARRFDLATMVLTSQYMRPGTLQTTLSILARVTDKLLIDVTNPRSLYGWWTRLRGWKSDESYFYSPDEIEALLQKAGFRIDHVAGFGLLSPLSIKKGFKGMVIRPWMTLVTRFLDLVFPRWCHLYYLECTSGVQVAFVKEREEPEPVDVPDLVISGRQG